MVKTIPGFEHTPSFALSDRRRVLLLAPFAPHLDASMGGPRMIAQMLMALARRERIGLLYLRAADEPRLDERVRRACEFAIETERPTAGPAPLVRRCVDAARTLAGTPTWVRDWCSHAYAGTLASLIAGWRPDIVQSEFHLMGQYLPSRSKGGLRLVLNQHEPGAAAVRDRRRAGLMPGAIVPLLEVRAWERYERRLLRRVDAVVTFTERDGREMQRLGAGHRLRVITPGTQIPPAPADPSGGQPPALLFFGNYVHAPNVDAALRLAEHIYPDLAARFPGLRLILLGDRAPDKLRACAGEHIEVPGRVPDLQPYLDRAAVIVVPIRLGGGIRVKVLEALSAGKALVASDLALEGLSLTDGEQVLRAETDEEFVQRVGWLLAHREERIALACRARAWAVERLSWDRAAQQYGDLYTELLAAPILASELQHT